MGGLRPHPLSRSVTPRAQFRHSASADRAGNDPARAVRGTGRISKSRRAPALMDLRQIAIITEFLRPSPAVHRRSPNKRGEVPIPYTELEQLACAEIMSVRPLGAAIGWGRH